MVHAKKKQNMVPLAKLNLTNRFLFDEVMEDPGTQQEVLSILLGHKVPLLLQNETEKELRISPAIRSVRLDVFAMDEDQNAYSTEMQSSRKADLSKRSRYYQALMDTCLLEPGIPDYNQLNNTYLIMIMTFDLFGYKRYRYTFRARCEEEKDCILEDGAFRIFFNTKGENSEGVSKELIDFLHYLEQTTDEAALRSGSARIQKIHERVCKVKASEEIGVKYMQAWEERYYDRQEALEAGERLGIRSKLLEQIQKKMDRGKSVEEIAEDLEESRDTVEALMKELGEAILTESGKK